MNNKIIQTGTIMDGISATPNIDEKKQVLDAAIGQKQQKDMMEVMAKYKIAHTPKIREYKINRNDPCPCGSGKKFKKCCIDKPEYNNYKLIK